MKIIFFFILLFSTSLFALQQKGPALQKISVQLEWKHQFEFAGFYAAKRQGYYTGIGLEDVNQ